MRVEVSGQKFTFPNCCVCCCKAANGVFTAKASKTKGKRVVHTTTRGWDFPCCSACLRHISAKQTADALGTLTFIAALITGLWLDSAQHIGVVIFLSAVAALTVLILLNIRARKLRSASCPCTGPSVSYLGWYGNQHSFDFSSTEYAREFLELNSRKVVNLSQEAHTLMVSVPPRMPAVAPRIPALRVPPVSDPDQQLLRCIEQLESAKGPASRRAILETTLRSIASEPVRQKLIAEAARIETNAVLDKVDSMRTVGAKRRIIQAAIDELKAEALPEEVRSVQLNLLETALKNAGGEF